MVQSLLSSHDSRKCMVVFNACSSEILRLLESSLNSKELFLVF